MNRGNQSAVSGEALKKLMTGGVLPGEYISEDNLNALLGHELEQMGDDEYYDTQVIEYCSKLLVENYADDRHKTQKQQRYDEIMAKIKQSGEGTKKHGKCLFFPMKKFIAACALTVVIVSALSVAAFNQDFFGDVFNWTKEIFLSLVGTSAEEQDKKAEASHSRQYKTVEDFEAAEGIKILTPEYMPNGIKIKAVIYYHDFETKNIKVEYDDHMTFLDIKLDETLPNMENIADVKYIENDGIVFYIIENRNTITWDYENNTYILTCGFEIGEYEKIIKNIK